MKLSELKNRRKALIAEMSNNSVAILSSANKNYRTRDVENPYRQNSDFLYMTGVNEPNLINLIFQEKDQVRSVLFRNNTSDFERIWEGQRLENSKILKKYGFSKVYDYDEYEEKMTEIMQYKDNLYVEFGLNYDLDKFIKKNFCKLHKGNKTKKVTKKNILSLISITHKLRQIKSNYEIEMIKEAASVSIKGHQEAMKKSRPGLYEYELDAEIKYVFNKNNMHYAYMSIVGGGNNACTLHYIKNDSLLKNNDLVLIDAAAENNGYASDITRTFPVNGKFTKEQALIYDVVLNAQEQAINFIKPGITWDQVHSITVKEISAGLINLGIIKGEIEDVIKKELYKEFYMHNTGHWLGLDVHDVGEYKNILFEPGMIITVEPGIYINLKNSKVLKKWRGIGIRIEDDVLITKRGNEVITKNLVKKRHQIEKMCNKKNG